MTALVAWLWQGLALAALTAVALRLRGNLSAATRHAVWWTALAGVLVLPLLPWLLSAAGPSSSAASPLTAHPPEASSLVVPSPPAWVAAALLGAWLGWVLLGLLGLLQGVARMANLKRTARPLPSRIARQLPLSTRACRSGRPATLRVSDRIDAPCALGLGEAVILLPRPLVAALDADALDQVVLHEYAHLERRDDWTRLVQALIEAVAGVHPAVRWIGRQIDVEREAACDDVVAARTGRPHDYARCLSAIAHLAAAHGAQRAGVPRLALGVARSPSTLRQRVTRLVDANRNGSIAPSRLWLSVGVAALSVVAVSAAQAPPLLEFRAASQAPRQVAAGRHQPAASTPVVKLRPTTVPPSPNTPAEFTSPATVRVARPTDRTTPDVQAAAGEIPATPIERVQAPPIEGPRTLAGEVRPSVPAAIPAMLRFEELHMDGAAGAHAPQAGGQPSVTDAEDSRWDVLARGGAQIGSASKKSGLAVASFFTRAGRSIAGAF